jgi:hypothetical protein
MLRKLIPCNFAGNACTGKLINISCKGWSWSISSIICSEPSSMSRTWTLVTQDSGTSWRIFKTRTLFEKSVLDWVRNLGHLSNYGVGSLPIPTSCTSVVCGIKAVFLNRIFANSGHRQIFLVPGSHGCLECIYSCSRCLLLKLEYKLGISSTMVHSTVYLYKKPFALHKIYPDLTHS